MPFFRRQRTLLRPRPRNFAWASLGVVADVIVGSNEAPLLNKIERVTPGAFATVGYLERLVSPGVWTQIGDPFDPAVDFIFYDSTFDPFGGDPIYRTRLSNGVVSQPSNEVTIDIPTIVGPDKPSISIADLDGDDWITDEAVRLVSSAYADDDDRAMFSVEWEVRTLAGVVIASVTRLITDPLDTSWMEEFIEGLTPPEATLRGYVRHLADDPDYDTPIPSEWSDPVEFTLLPEVEEEPAPDIGLGEADQLSYKSEYPYGTYSARVEIPAFDQMLTVCSGSAVAWFATVYKGSRTAAVFEAERHVNYTFALAGTRPSLGFSWKYRCYTPTAGPLRAYFSSATTNVELPFAPDTPFVFELCNIAEGQRITSNGFLLRWEESPYMMCAGVSVNQSTAGGVRDPVLRAAEGELLYDGAIDIWKLPDFGGTWTIDAMQNGVVYPLLTVPFGHRSWVGDPSGASWLHRAFYDVLNLGEVDEVGWEETLNLASVPDGVTQLCFKLDGRVERYTHPFILDRSEIRSFRYAGEDLEKSILTIGGDEGAADRWADIPGIGVRVSGAGSSHAALPLEVGSPKTFSLIIGGAWASRKDVTDVWSLMFDADADSNFGAAGYLLQNEEGYSAIAGALGLTGIANGYNRVTNQGEGALTASWWANGPRHARGIAGRELYRVGPRAAEPDDRVALTGSTTFFTRWNQSGVGFGPDVALPLRPRYSIHLKVEYLNLLEDGTQQIRVSLQTHGPDNDQNSNFQAVRTINLFRWDPGRPGLFAFLASSSAAVDFYSASILIGTEDDPEGEDPTSEVPPTDVDPPLPEPCEDCPPAIAEALASALWAGEPTQLELPSPPASPEALWEGATPQDLELPLESEQTSSLWGEDA